MKINLSLGTFALRHIFFGTTTSRIFLVIVLAGILVYLVNSKITDESESGRANLSGGEPSIHTVSNGPGHTQAAHEEKGLGENENEALPSFEQDSVPEQTDGTQAKDQEALEKMHRPFSAHTMTPEEERFRELAMGGKPVSNIVVHDTGVVFFWAEPKDAGNSEKREDLMEELAHLYKEQCSHSEPVTVVFLISGRPVQSKKFY